MGLGNTLMFWGAAFFLNSFFVWANALAEPVQKSGRPSAPTITALTPGNGRAQVDWTPPSSTGESPITHYRVRWELATGGQIQTADVTSDLRSLTLFPLANGVSYKVFIRAKNESGWGPFRAFPDPVIPKGPPEAPTLISVTPGNGQASIQWNPPASDEGSPITGYRVRWQIASKGQPFQIIDLDKDKRSHTVTGLKNGTPYWFFVRAKNKAGWGSFRGFPNSITPFATPPHSLSESGELRIEILGNGAGTTLYREEGFYHLDGGVEQARKSFELSQVKRIRVSGDSSPNQWFKVGPGPEEVISHPLTVEPSIESSFVLGKVKAPGEVSLRSASIVLGADITSTGPQTYVGKVEISGNRVLQAENSNITFESELDSSLLVFADPDSAPLGADLSTFFPDISFTRQDLHNGGYSSTSPVAAVTSGLQVSPTQIYAPTGKRVFGACPPDENGGCDTWQHYGEGLGKNYRPSGEGSLLRLVFKKPFRNISLDFTPRSLDDSGDSGLFGSPRLGVSSEEAHLLANGRPPYYFDLEPEVPVFVFPRTTATLGIKQTFSERPIFVAEAGWQRIMSLTSRGAQGILDNFQGTLWEKPLQTLSILTNGTWSCAGQISDRLNVITRDGIVTPPRVSHLFEGQWDGSLSFVIEGVRRFPQRFQLSLSQEVNEVTGSLVGSSFQGELVGSVEGNDLNATVTLTSGPCSGSTLNLKMTEYSGVLPKYKMEASESCAAFQPSLNDLKRKEEGL